MATECAVRGIGPYQDARGLASDRSLGIAQRALAALRKRDHATAWLLADKLCRSTVGNAAADAHLLRSAILAGQGDQSAAAADLLLAGFADPLAPAVNRALLRSPDPGERREAARNLLHANEPGAQECGLAALARERVAVVGMIELAGDRLAGRVWWTGSSTLTLAIRTDIGEQPIEVVCDEASQFECFQHAGRFYFDVPTFARVVSVSAPGLDGLFEPAGLSLAQQPSYLPAEAKAGDEPLPLLVIVPVYDDVAATRACFESLTHSATEPERLRIIAVDDAAPDRVMSDYLDDLAAAGAVELLRNPVNLGFAGSINRALSRRLPGQDVLLLNADTIVPAGAIEGLARHAHGSADIGTVTPLSNNGEDTSLPIRFRVNSLPDRLTVERLNRLACEVNAGCAVDMPNGVGFCHYLRGDVVDLVGPLSHEYGRGYYEDVDYCLRVADAGFRNVCATDVYVGHHGGRSFGSLKRGLVARNLRQLTARYPGYLAAARLFETNDPLRIPIGRLEEAYLKEASQPLDLLILPDETPQILTTTLATAVTRPDRPLVIVRSRKSAHRLHLDLISVAGDIPQNVTWEVAAAGSLEVEREIGARLAALPIGAVTIVDAGKLPHPLLRALAACGVQIQLVTADPVSCRETSRQGLRASKRIASLFPEAPQLAVTPSLARFLAARTSSDRGVPTLAFPALPELAVPLLKPSVGPLAVIGAGHGAADLVLLTALARELEARRPAALLVIAGEVTPGTEAALPANVFVSGRVSDEELPAWLTRLEATAAVFASSCWGMADPRASLWADAGLPIVRFDGGCITPRREAAGLVLPPSGRRAAMARAIVDWWSE